VLAIPPDMGVADFCEFLGGCLRSVREMRFVRRDGGKGVCLVLLRFDSQDSADSFYQNYNTKPVRPSSFCSLNESSALLHSLAHGLFLNTHSLLTHSSSSAVLLIGARRSLPAGVCKRRGTFHSHRRRDAATSRPN
jgi:BRCA1-associated protein 2